MATKLFLRDTQTNPLGNDNNGLVYNDMLPDAGASQQNYQWAVTPNGVSNEEFTGSRGAYGGTNRWISGRAPVGGFTLSGQITFSIWDREFDKSVNAGIRCEVYKRSGTTETLVAGASYGKPTEVSYSASTEYVWTVTPASGVSFAEDDRVVLRVFIVPVSQFGTLGQPGPYGTLSFNSADGGTADSFLQLNETVTFKAEAPPVPPSALTDIIGCGIISWSH